MPQIKVQKIIGEYLGILPDARGHYYMPGGEKIKVADVVEMVQQMENSMTNKIFELQERINYLANEITVKNAEANQF